MKEFFKFFNLIIGAIWVIDALFFEVESREHLVELFDFFDLCKDAGNSEAGDILRAESFSVVGEDFLQILLEVFQIFWEHEIVDPTKEGEILVVENFIGLFFELEKYSILVLLKEGVDFLLDDLVK